MSNMSKIVKESFTQYSGAVLQSRALVDVRDILKPSARQIFYCLHTDKFTHDKAFKKTLKAIGSATRMYIHGDSSCEGVIMRAGQPFAMRYPLIEVEGSYGNLMESGNWAAPRYCLVGDTLVNTSRGLIRLDSIAKTEDNSDNPIERVYFKGFNKITSSDLIFNSGRQSCYKITLKNGLFVEGTSNHPVLTLDEDLNFCWKTLFELQPGDKVLINLGHNLLYPENTAYNDVGMARALGCLVSEGCLTVRNKIDMINSDLDMIMPVQNLLTKYGSKATYKLREQKDHCYQISTTNEILYKELQGYGCCVNSHNKTIPTYILEGTRECQVEFLKYLFEGDGCICIKDGGYGIIAYSSVSKQLISELQILLATNFGIMSSIHTQTGRNEYKLEIGGEDVYRFYQEIGFVSERKCEKLQQAAGYYVKAISGKSTGSRGWHIYPEIKSFLSKNYPYSGLIVHRTNRADECKGPLMSKAGLPILKAKLHWEDYEKIRNLYENYAYVAITKKEYTGIKTVYSPKINEPTNEYTSNGLISHNTSARLTPLAEHLFKDIKKDTIAEWKDNYDDTEQYPVILPTKGFYNLVNGTSGIGVGAASSIPQFNIKELNIALIRLLVNPSSSFEDIYCAPDFATGGILLNEAEVKESLKKGTGAACKLRAVMNYDATDNCLVVTEIPYGVYTNTICGELEAILGSEDNPGIDRFNDLTGSTPLIKIYLNKGANVNKITQHLYKNTSLEHYYGINMTMLRDGRYPQVFSFKEALVEYLKHEREVYRRAFKFDLNKIDQRLNIIDGLLIAIADIDNVIKIIKSSKNKDTARQALIAAYNFNLEQVNAILDMKLSRLTNLETVDLETEKGELLKEQARINAILADEKLLNNEIEAGLREVMNKFGDARRTKIMNVSTAVNDTETAEFKPTKYIYTLVDGNSILPLLPENKINLGKKGSQYVKNKVSCGYIGYNNETAFAFDTAGVMYRINNMELECGVINPIITVNPVACLLPRLNKKYLITVTKNGVVKKSLVSEYAKIARNIVAVKVRDGDTLVWAGCADDNDCLYLLGAGGGLVKVRMSDINTTGRATIGAKGISDMVVGATIANDEQLVFTYADGKGKFTLGSDFNITAKAAKGQVIAEKTIALCTVNEMFYIVEKNNKLTQYTNKSFAVKSKAAIGAKVSDENNVILIN